MDSDGIGILAVAAVFVAVCAGVLLWARAMGQRREKSILAMTRPLGFVKITNSPEDFPLNSFPMVRWGEKGGRIFASAYRGERNGREVLFFNYILFQGTGSRRVDATVYQTTIAARGGPECFPAAKSDPTLHLETADEWTVAYRLGKILSADEILALLLSVPGRS